MHFWDSPDHLFKANFDLLLENNRMYFHNATAHYGGVPLKMTGRNVSPGNLGGFV